MGIHIIAKIILKLYFNKNKEAIKRKAYLKYQKNIYIRTDSIKLFIILP